MNPTPNLNAPSPEVREKVKAFLLSSAAFRALSPAQQREIAYHTLQVVDHFANPERLPQDQLIRAQLAAAKNPDHYAFSLASPTTRSTRGTEPSEFKAQATREGVE